MFVRIVSGLPGFALKDSGAGTADLADRTDGMIAACIQWSIHVKQFPWKLLFTELDALYLSLHPLIASLHVLLTLTQRGHMAPSCAGASGMPSWLSQLVGSPIS